jgi:hypothetical protein
MLKDSSPGCPCWTSAKGLGLSWSFVVEGVLVSMSLLPSDPGVGW